MQTANNLPPSPPPPRTWRALPLGIWALGFVSLCMDTSSELIHSLLPVFMVSTPGASMITIGIIEGVAEATASATKVFSGALSDYLGRRKIVMNLFYAGAAYPAGVAADHLGQRPLVLLGLALLIAADIVLALAPSPLLVFAGAALWGLHMAFTQGFLAKLMPIPSPKNCSGPASASSIS